MPQPSEIEKKSLEAHVELCAERYKYLYDQISNIDEKVDTVHTTVSTIDAKIDQVVANRNNQLINWGIGIIVALLSTLGWLIKNYVL